MESDSGQNVFDKLFKLLEPDALSIEEGFRQCRFKLVKFFGYRHCEDAEGLADETISRLLKNVRAGQEISPDNPYRYVYAIAMNVFREYVRAKKKGEVIDDIEQIGDLSAPEEADDCLRQCLEQIPRRNASCWSVTIWTTRAGRPSFGSMVSRSTRCG